MTKEVGSYEVDPQDANSMLYGMALLLNDMNKKLALLLECAERAQPKVVKPFEAVIGKKVQKKVTKTKAKAKRKAPAKRKAKAKRKSR